MLSGSTVQDCMVLAECNHASSTQASEPSPSSSLSLTSYCRLGPAQNNGERSFLCNGNQAVGAHKDQQGFRGAHGWRLHPGPPVP